MTPPAPPADIQAPRLRGALTVCVAALLCLAASSCRLAPNAALPGPAAFGGGDACAPCATPLSADETARSTAWARDEYVCDGGDLGLRAKVQNDWSIDGLEPEDTVVHFDTLAGQVVVVPSNQSCIYAPRFAAARHVTRAAQSEIRELAAHTADQLAPACRAADDPASTVKQPLGAALALGGAMGRSLQEELPGRLVDQVLQPEAGQDALLPFQSEQLLILETLHASEKALLSEGLTAAISWSAVELPQVIVDTTAALATSGARQSEEVVVYATPDGVRVRLVKLASRREAAPGETVEFTLRVENVGPEEVGNVTVVDHLSPRLEYVADSQQCSVPSNFSTDDQARAGLAVRWEITQPLPPGAAAVITFVCRVR